MAMACASRAASSATKDAAAGSPSDAAAKTVAAVTPPGSPPASSKMCSPLPLRASFRALVASAARACDCFKLPPLAACSTAA